jgi:hypothetical protein
LAKGKSGGVYGVVEDNRAQQRDESKLGIEEA